MGRIGTRWVGAIARTGVNAGITPVLTQPPIVQHIATTHARLIARQKLAYRYGFGEFYHATSRASPIAGLRAPAGPSRDVLVSPEHWKVIAKKAKGEFLGHFSIAIGFMSHLPDEPAEVVCDLIVMLQSPQLR
jgi:hypothetical protein